MPYMQRAWLLGILAAVGLLSACASRELLGSSALRRITACTQIALTCSFAAWT
jgi:hypothetical protein